MMEQHLRSPALFVFTLMALAACGPQGPRPGDWNPYSADPPRDENYHGGPAAILRAYDANGDGLIDLIYSSTAPGPSSKQVERYEVFLQHKGMTFGQKPSQTIEVPYEYNADKTFRDLNPDRVCVLPRGPMTVVSAG